MGQTKLHKPKPSVHHITYQRPLGFQIPGEKAQWNNGEIFGLTSAMMGRICPLVKKDLGRLKI